MECKEWPGCVYEGENQAKYGHEAGEGGDVYQVA